MHPARQHESDLLRDCEFILLPQQPFGVTAEEYLFVRPGAVSNLRRSWNQASGRWRGPQPHVHVVHRPSGIRSHDSREAEDWPKHPSKALRRLRLRLAVAIRSDEAYPPSATWRAHCEGRCLYVKRKHRDYPALLAEAMDSLAFHDWRYGGAADHLGVWRVQLIRFVCKHGSAKVRWNQELAARGERLIELDSRRHRLS